MPRAPKTIETPVTATVVAPEGQQHPEAQDQTTVVSRSVLGEDVQVIVLETPDTAISAAPTTFERIDL